MKIIALSMFLMTLSIAAAEPPAKPWLTPLREKLEQKMTFEIDETFLDEALTLLRSKTSVPIIVDPGAFADAGPEISVNLKDRSLADVLKKMLDGADLQFAPLNEAVFIFKRNVYAATAMPAAGALPDDKAKEVTAAINALGSDDFTAREKANTTLVGFGAAAAPYLNEAAHKCADPEMYVRLQNLLAPYKGKPFPEPKADVAKFLDGLSAPVTFEYEDTKLEDAIKELNESITQGGGKALSIEIPKELATRQLKAKATMQTGNALRWLAILSGSTLALEGDKIKFVKS